MRYLLAAMAFCYIQFLMWGQGAGIDPPRVTWHAVDPNTLQICWQTNQPSSVLIEHYLFIGGGYTSPQADRWDYTSDSMTTGGCQNVTGLDAGKTYLFNVATSHNALHCATNMSCGLGDEQASIASYGQGQNGIQMTTPTPTGSTLQWSIKADGSPTDVYPGQRITVALNGIWSAGPLPTYVFQTAATIDGQACGSGAVEACPLGMTLQYLESNQEVQNAATRNADTPVASSGSYAGHAFCQHGAQGQCFGPVTYLVLDVPSSATSNQHTLTATFQATDGSQNNIGPPQVLTFPFTVLAQPTFTVHAPAIHPALTDLPAWPLMQHYMQTIGIPLLQQCLAQQTGSPWRYWNGVYSATDTVIPCALWNYDSLRGLYWWADNDPTNRSLYLNVAERVQEQVRDFQRIEPQVYPGQEWQQVNTYGSVMHACRNYLNCGGLTTPDIQGLGCFLYPFLPPCNQANHNQMLQSFYLTNQVDTWRPANYIENTLEATSKIGRSPVEANGINDQTMRDPQILQQFIQFRQYNPNITNGLGLATYDLGLAYEPAVFRWQDTQNAALAVELMNVLDKAYAWLWTGPVLGFPYTPWTRPYMSAEYNAGNYANLDGFQAWAYAWCEAVDAGHILPSTGKTCAQVADELEAHAFQNPSGTAKEFTQLMRDWPKYVGYRTGGLSATDADWLPAHNAYQGFTTAAIEPYPQGVIPAAPVASVSGSCVTLTWRLTQPAACSAEASSNGGGSWNTAITGGNAVPVPGSNFLYQCPITTCGLASAQYTWGPGGTNAAGLQAFTPNDPLTGRMDWQFYIPPTPGVRITTTSLPAGQAGKGYSQQIGASGGSPPYTFH